MADFKPEAVIFSLTFCFLLCAAVRQSPREAHIGYLYDKPGHTLEVPVKDFVKDSEEDTYTEDVHIPEHASDHNHKPHDEYLPPKSDGFGHHSKGEHEHHIRTRNEKRDLEKSEKKSVKQHEVPSREQDGRGFTRKSN